MSSKKTWGKTLDFKSTNDNSKNKIILLIDRLGGGGAERVVVEIASHLPLNFECLVVCTRDTGTSSYVDMLVEKGIPIISIGRKSRFDIRGFFVLRNLINTFKPDIIHSHKYGSNVIARITKLTFRKFPILICHEHTWSYNPKERTRIIINKLLSPLSDAIIAVSENDKKSLIEIEGLPADKISVIYNGIDFQRLMPSVEIADFLPTIGLDNSSFIAVVLAKLHSQKGHEVLFKALTQIIITNQNFQLLVVGEGVLEASLRELAHDLNIDANIKFLGFRSDIGNILAACDLVILPSFFEGHPIALLEAMAAGKIVIATNVGGVPEVIQDGKTGLLVRANSIADLVEKTNEVINNFDDYKLMGAEASKDIRSKFSIEKSISEYLELYSELLNKKY